MQRFKNILYVSERGVAQTATMLRAVILAEKNQAELTVIDVIPTFPASKGVADGEPDLSELQAAMMSDSRQNLESLIEPHRQRLNINCEVLLGMAFLEIIRAVLRTGYDLVIKPAGNPDFLQRRVGSEDMHLLRKCPCPVWLMKSEEKANYGSILAAVDFDPLGPGAEKQEFNQQILGLSASLALSDFAALHLVHAWESFAENKLTVWSDKPAGAAVYVEKERLRHETGLAQLGEWLRGLIGAETYDSLSPRIHLRKGQARKVITALAGELKVDLIVMGTVARTGISGLIIGNTAEAILEQVQCSVLALKPAGFISPIKLEE